MLQGVCADNGQSAVLEKGKRYFLFPNDPKHYYVSNFPNKDAHKGCFSVELFQISNENDWPAEPEMKQVDVDQGKVYQATLIWRRPGYKSTKLKEYYLKPKETHAYFYHDKQLKKCGGCYPLHWFSGFAEVTEDNEPISDNILLEFEENDHILVQDEPKIRGYEQLSFF